MAIQSQPSRIPEPFAGSGSKNTIPATNTTPSASQAASWASGFPPECSQPISAGGCPVPRNDVNGALNQLSQDFAFRQDGGIWEWSALADYDVQRIVRGSDGLLYYSIAQSGPSVAAGAQDPTLDLSRSYWAAQQVPEMPSSDSSAATASTGWVNSWHDANIATPPTFYLDVVNGDDNNDGTTAATAKKTLSSIIDKLKKYNSTKGLSLRIYVAAGDYKSDGQAFYFRDIQGVFLEFIFEQGAIIGDFTVYSSYVSIDGCVSIRGAVGVYNNACLFFGLNTGQVQVTLENFTAYNLISVNNCSTVSQAYNSSVSFIFSSVSTSSSGGATIAVGNCGSFVKTLGGSTTMSFSGTVGGNGHRYSCTMNGVIANMGSTTAIPGPTNGVTNTGGQYS